MGITSSNTNTIELLDNCTTNKQELINWMCENIHTDAEYVTKFINAIKDENIILKQIDYTFYPKKGSININVVIQEFDTNKEVEMSGGFILKQCVY